MRKTAMKKWTLRVLGSATAAGAVLIAAALPASAHGNTVTAWGNTQAEAVNSAINFCLNTLHGQTAGVGSNDVKWDGSRYKAVITCSY